mgnify:CR=1 FL=1
MASSGSVDFSVNRNDIITRSLEVIGEYDPGETISSADVTTCASWLNLIVKQLQGTADFAGGLKMWSRKRAYLFLSGGQAVYTLGPTTTATGTTNKWASSYVTTTISANEAAGQTVLSVTSITGISNADRIGIELDDDTMHWTTVNGAPSGGTVTITASLASAAASGNRVFAYATTAQGRSPIKILTASLRSFDSTNVPTDIPIDAGLLIEGYESIVSKTADSDPTALYYEQTLTDGTVYLDAEPSDVSKIIRMVYLSAIEDFDASTDTPDYPQEYYLFLVMELGKYIAPVFGVKWTTGMEDNRKSAMAIAKNLYPETSDLYFQCNA